MVNDTTESFYFFIYLFIFVCDAVAPLSGGI